MILPQVVKNHPIFLSLLLVFTLLFFFRVPILTSVGQFLVIQEPLEEVGVIHPLAGDKERILYGVSLYQQGYGELILFTGGDRSPFDPYMETIATYAQKQDIPQEAIRTAPATSTFEESVALKRLTWQKSDVGKAMVVSSPFHMRRVKMIFNEVMPDDVELVFRHVPWKESAYKKRWWKTEDGILMVITEYIKLPYYIFKYVL